MSVSNDIGGRILVIDDDTAFLRLICRLLNEAGFECEARQDVGDNVVTNELSAYDLVLIDRQAGHPDSLEVVRQIRDNPNTASIPVIVLSTSDREAEGLEAGADDYIVKPFSRAVLIARVRAHLRLRAQELELKRSKESELAALEQVGRAKTQFLANMSHEIRTPMTGVLGMLDLLLDTPLNEEQQNLAETAFRSAEHLLRLIDDILNFSKLEAGKLTLEEIDFDLHTTIADLVELFALQARAKDVGFRVNLDEHVPQFVRGDPARLRQVLFNLLGNALKFTTEGELKLSIARERYSDTSTSVRFRIRDTGIGIAEDKIANLFEPFRQADASTSRVFGGSGLGLAISRQLVSLMGGEIGVTSKVGEGSTFWFTTTLKPASDAERPSNDSAVLKGTRVLIVDDNAECSESFSHMLTTWEMPHDLVINGTEALSILRGAAEAKRAFDVVIVDKYLPGMDGETLGLRIKADEALKDTILVMATSIGERGDCDRLAKIGFAAYLLKPVVAKDLRDCLAMSLAVREEAEGDSCRIITRYTAVEARKQQGRVLVVDDNMVNRKVAVAMLDKLGYQSHAVENGRDALDYLKIERCDLVLMDLQMPELDGYAATRLIRDTTSAVLDHAVPIVAMTAHAMAETHDACIEAGMNDRISKPFRREELAEMVGKWIVGSGHGMRRMWTRSSQTGNRLMSVSTDASSTRKHQQRQSIEGKNITSNETGSVFDPENLVRRTGGNKTLAAELVTIYLADTKKQVKRLRESLDANDLKSTTFIAHAIKGSSGTIAATQMYEISANLEKAARKRNGTKAATLFAQLDLQFEQASTVASAWLRDNQQS